MSNLDVFLQSLEKKLPDVCSDNHLIKNIPKIFKNTLTLKKMRLRGQSPTYFSIDVNFYYLKKDVLSWFRSRYITHAIV